MKSDNDLDLQFAKPYNYDLYCKVWDVLKGRTIHYEYYIGYSERQYKKLDVSTFERKFKALQELEREEPTGPDEMEADSNAMSDLASELFLYEKLNPYYLE